MMHLLQAETQTHSTVSEEKGLGSALLVLDRGPVLASKLARALCPALHPCFAILFLLTNRGAHSIYMK